MKREIRWVRCICTLCCVAMFLSALGGKIKVEAASSMPSTTSLPHEMLAEETRSYGNYEYQIISKAKKTIAITKIKNYGETVVVPAKINGYTVKCLGGIRDADEMNVFQKSDQTVKKLILSDGITHIGDNACEGLITLQEVKLPKKLKYIGDSAFSGCILLKNWDLPAALESGGYNCFGGIALDTIIVRGGLPGEFSKDHNVKKLILCGSRDYCVDLNWNGIYQVICRPSVKSISCQGVAKKVYIQGKKTRIFEERCPDYKIFALDRAACRKDVKDWAWNMTVCKLPKLKVVSVKKKNKSVYTWSKEKAVIKHYTFPESRKGKLKSQKKCSLVYEVLFKKKGTSKYVKTKTTKGTSWSTKKDGVVRVKATAKNYWPKS